MGKASAAILSFIGENSAAYDGIARDIWEHPEVAFHEERSSAVYEKRLASKGFSITEFPEMKYSFVAERGSGGPVIAFMGEYDALPGMSQACAVERRKPAVEGAPGPRLRPQPPGRRIPGRGRNSLSAPRGAQASRQSAILWLSGRGIPWPHSPRKSRPLQRC